MNNNKDFEIKNNDIKNNAENFNDPKDTSRYEVNIDIDLDKELAGEKFFQTSCDYVNDLKNDEHNVDNFCLEQKCETYSSTKDIKYSYADEDIFDFQNDSEIFNKVFSVNIDDLKQNSNEVEEIIEVDNVFKNINQINDDEYEDIVANSHLDNNDELEVISVEPVSFVEDLNQNYTFDENISDLKDNQYLDDFVDESSKEVFAKKTVFDEENIEIVSDIKNVEFKSLDENEAILEDDLDLLNQNKQIIDKNLNDDFIDVDNSIIDINTDDKPINLIKENIISIFENKTEESINVEKENNFTTISLNTDNLIMSFNNENNLKNNNDEYNDISSRINTITKQLLDETNDQGLMFENYQVDNNKVTDDLQEEKPKNVVEEIKDKNKKILDELNFFLKEIDDERKLIQSRETIIENRNKKLKEIMSIDYAKRLDIIEKEKRKWK